MQPVRPRESPGFFQGLSGGSPSAPRDPGPRDSPSAAETEKLDSSALESPIVISAKKLVIPPASIFLGTILGPTWCHFGGQVGLKIYPKWTYNPFQQPIKKMIAFWIALGTDFARFLVSTWLQLGPKLAPSWPTSRRRRSGRAPR